MPVESLMPTGNNIMLNDSDITRSVVDPDFLLPRENAKWACLNLLRIALTILKKH